MNSFIFNEADCGCVIRATQSTTVFTGIDESLILRPQQILLLPKRNGVRFSCEMAQVLHLNRDVVSDFLQYLVVNEDLSAIRQRNIPDYLVAHCSTPYIFEEAARLSDILSESIIDKARCYSLTFSIISRFLSHRYAQGLLVRMMKSRISDEVYRRVYQFPQEDWTLSRMAQCFAMSDSSLKKKLQQEGTSYTHLVKASRMQVAMKLLRDGYKNITYIATQSGYHSTSHFIAVFRKYHGISPYQYQKKHYIEGLKFPH